MRNEHSLDVLPMIAKTGAKIVFVRRLIIAEIRKRLLFVCALTIFVLLTQLGNMSTASAQILVSVQAGCFSEENVALDLLADLRRDAFQCRTEKKDGLTYVLCGEFISREGGESLRLELVRKGYEGSFLVDAPHFDVPSESRSNGSPQRSFKAVQVGSFRSEDNADSVISELGDKGLVCRKQKMDGNYKVYCGKVAILDDAGPVQAELDALGYTSSFVVVLPETPFFSDAVEKPAQAPDHEMRILQVPDALLRKPEPVVPAMVEAPPLVDSVEVMEPKGEGIDGDIFGKVGGHLHPFIGVTSYYLDNVYYSDQDKKADLLTVFSGGLWFSAPGIKRLMLEQPSGSLPGGVKKKSILNETERPYQAYFMYKADVERYSKYDSGNYVNHKAEALVSLNGSGGHRIEISDIYQKTHDAKGEEPVEELGEFSSNNINLSAVFAITSKLLLRADYGQFKIDYEKDSLLYKEHEDRTYSAYVYFRVLPKTSVYVEHTSTDIDYEDIYLLDSTEKDYLLGLQWDITEKTKGDVRAGYSTREFDSSARGKSSGIKILGELGYWLSRKTMIEVEAGRFRREPGEPLVDFVTEEHAAVRFINMPVSKIRWSVRAAATKLTYEGSGADRVDDNLSGSAHLNYYFKKWISAYAGYRYDKRSSTQQGKGYTANMVYLGFMLSL